MKKPSVIVSATCFDLGQVRADLRVFLEDQLGYRALLSDFASFPVDPSLDLIENCRQRVERDSDLFVLVVGGRYGSIDTESQKSITNLEYLSARAVGVPVFAFVEKRILSMLPIWKKNPDANYSEIVDAPSLFAFVDSIASTHNVWVHPFEYAGDVVNTLREQLAYRFEEGLVVLRRLRACPAYLRDLNGPGLRLVMDKRRAWEYYLFAECLIDQVGRSDELRREHRAGLAIGLGEDVADVPAWVKFRLSDLRKLVSGLEQLTNTDLRAALGPPGTPGDAEALHFVAAATGRVMATSCGGDIV